MRIIGRTAFFLQTAKAKLKATIQARHVWTTAVFPHTKAAVGAALGGQIDQLLRSQCVSVSGLFGLFILQTEK